MKSRVLLTALFVVLLTGLVCYANDVMINGDFEVVDPNNADRPLAWSPQAFSTNSSFAYVYDPAGAFSGSRYVAITVPTRDDRGQWGQEFRDLPAGDYKLSLYYRIDEPLVTVGSAVGSSVRILRLTKSWEKVFPDTMYDVDNYTFGEWEYAEFIFEVTPEVEVIWIEPFNWFGVGTVYFDAVKLEKVN